MLLQQIHTVIKINIVFALCACTVHVAVLYMYLCVYMFVVSEMYLKFTHKNVYCESVREAHTLTCTCTLNTISPGSCTIPRYSVSWFVLFIFSVWKRKWMVQPNNARLPHNDLTHELTNAHAGELSKLAVGLSTDSNYASSTSSVSIFLV